MAIFGFICALLLVSIITAGFILVLIMDGSWGGRREINMYWAGVILIIIASFWRLIFIYAPLSVVVS